MDLDLDYDYLGNVHEFDYDNVESIIKTLAPSTGNSTYNDSQEFHSDNEVEEISKAVPKNVIKSKNKALNETSNPLITTSKKGKRSSKRLKNKKNTKNDDSENTQKNPDLIYDLGNEAYSSDEELNNELFSILDKPSNSTNMHVNTTKGRARRTYFANLAESIPNKEFVDLTDLQPISTKKSTGRPTRDPNVVVIGSDDDYDDVDLNPISIKLCNADLHNCGDINSENPECKIKIQWRGKIEIHLLRKFQKFNDLIKLLADRKNCEHQDILLNLNSTIISSDDSPDSINYKISDIINGRIVKNSNIVSTKQKNNDELIIKIIANGWKRPIEISINKNDSVSILYIKVSEEIKKATDKFVLMFDGDVLSISSKIEDLELEGGELLEITFK